MLHLIFYAKNAILFVMHIIYRTYITYKSYIVENILERETGLLLRTTHLMNLKHL